MKRLTDPELAFIVHALEEKNYSEAMRAITNWLQSQRSVVTPWRDPQVAASKLELKALEEHLRDLIDHRNARIQLLDEFNDLYFSRLGPLMQQILAPAQNPGRSRTVRRQEAEARRREADYLRCQHYLAQAVEVLVTLTQRWRGLPPHSVQAAEARKHLQQQSELIASLLAEAQELERGLTREEEPARQARDEARQEYESYQEQQHDAEKRFSFEQKMSEDERHELKRLWRQASKLCHPDLVANDLKNEAHGMMVQLNQARQRGDVSAIRAILTRLQKGLEPLMASDRLNDLERIRQRIAEVKQHIASLIERAGNAGERGVLAAGLVAEQSGSLLPLSRKKRWVKFARRWSSKSAKLNTTKWPESSKPGEIPGFVIISCASTPAHAPAADRYCRSHSAPSAISPPPLPRSAR